MIFLLDSNVISEVWKPSPDAKVMAFFEQSEWYIPAPVIAEIQEGAEASSSLARRIEINLKLDALLSEQGGIVMDWDSETARVWGRLRHSPEVKRQPQSLWDSLIDSMAVRYGATVATRNQSDFRHAKTLNPWLDTSR